MATAVAWAGPTGHSANSLSQAPLPATLGDTERQLSDVEKGSHEAQNRISKLTAEIGDLERITKARGRAYARLIRSGLLPVSGGFESFLAHVSRVEGTRRQLGRDLEKLERAKIDQRDLSKMQESLQARKQALAAHRDALSQAQMASEQMADRQRAFDSAFTSSKKTDDYVAVYSGVTVREPTKAVEGFAALKGKLPFPLAGRAEAKTARRSGSRGLGLELSAPVGSSVRAVYAGRVVFSAKFGDFGQVIILDHGNNYFTVYGGLGAMDVKIGDEVPAGSRIGSVGDDGRGGMLYVEVRRGQDTLDPKEWFGV